MRNSELQGTASRGTTAAAIVLASLSMFSTSSRAKAIELGKSPLEIGDGVKTLEGEGGKADAGSAIHGELPPLDEFLAPQEFSENGPAAAAGEETNPELKNDKTVFADEDLAFVKSKFNAENRIHKLFELELELPNISPKELKEAYEKLYCLLDKIKGQLSDFKATSQNINTAWEVISNELDFVTGRVFTGAMNNNTYDCDIYSIAILALADELKAYDQNWNNLSLMVLPRHAFLEMDGSFYDQGDSNTKEYYVVTLNLPKEGFDHLFLSLKGESIYSVFYRNRGNTYLRLGEYEKAIEDLDKAIKICPNLADAYTIRGVAYTSLKRYADAVLSYDQAIEFNPNDALTYYNRGNAYFRLGIYQLAIADFDRTVEIDPKHEAAYNNRGYAYEELKEYEKAIENYDQVIKLNPNFEGIYYNRGMAYSKLEKFKKALEDFSQAVRIDPNDAAAHYHRGNANYGLKEYERAVQDYGQAIKIFPNYERAYVYRGISYFFLGKGERAIEDFDQAIKINPDDAESYFFRGIAYKELKEYQRAIKDFDLAIKINPDFALAQKYRRDCYEETKK